ncbi:uncharacterized protein B0H18DRAFT_968775 [Fomitopsis serialis]|uniref:uncharacterized protein n=1 Tax=Fomitopsis serialis TaxID=139415 RepID=UPI0020088B44|nr:uncharacterized protein B0H18DRAFT_968775 [Neoantrodia serialis]KAH9937014.1 hypothetical protein B0H18DRAFT_968775 [Neoantrodia serialis]
MEDPEIQDVPVPDVPWFRGSTDARPFILSKVLNSTQSTSLPFHCTATFPWSSSSMECYGKILADWKKTTDDYAGSVAIGGTGAFYPFCIRLPDETWEVQCAAWALSLRHPTDPLIVFAPSSVIYILDVKTRRIIGRLRGTEAGKPITSIAVHPVQPYLRIYDLTCNPLQHPNNPCWPPSKKPSLAGPAFGLQMTESEGEGIGQCVAVLVGGGRAFHRTEPLIATCGVDRAVKIWRIPPLVEGHLAREDKPLFSTDYIHKARVLSIAWLSHDILISHSAPALMREGDEPDDLYVETAQIWQWLGMNRFSARRGDKPIPKVMRGCASDYRNSGASFKVLSAYHLPLTALHASVYTRAAFNVTHFRPRPRPPFPLDEDEVVALTKRMRLDDGDGDGGGDAGHSGNAGQSSSGRDEGERGAHGEVGTPRGAANRMGKVRRSEDEGDQDVFHWDAHREGYMVRQRSRLEELFAAVEGWDIDLSAVAEGRRAELPDIRTCEVASGGRVILGAGDRGTMYVWRLAE